MGFLTRFVLVLEVLYPALAAAGGPAVPRITSVQYSGSGCPNNAARSGDFNNPTFKYSNFAAISPGTSKTANCEVHVQADGASAGWQVALSQVNVQGHLKLDAGMNLDYYTQTFFSENAGNTGTVRGSIASNGGKVDRSVGINQAMGDQKVWSKCIGGDGNPGMLNVNFRTALIGDGHGYFEVQTENWDFVWRQC